MIYTSFTNILTTEQGRSTRRCGGEWGRVKKSLKERLNGQRHSFLVPAGLQEPSAA